VLSPKFLEVCFAGRPRIGTLYVHPDHFDFWSEADGESEVVHSHFAHKAVQMQQNPNFLVLLPDTPIKAHPGTDPSP